MTHILSCEVYYYMGLSIVMGAPPVPIYKWDFPANHPAIGVPLLVGTPPYIQKHNMEIHIRIM